MVLTAFRLGEAGNEKGSGFEWTGSWLNLDCRAGGVLVKVK